MPYDFFADVDRVLDGDTISATLFLGFDVQFGPKGVRLSGINAPEIHSKIASERNRAQAAADFITARLLPVDPAAKPQVRIQTEKPDSEEKYGRIFGRVLYLPPAPPKPKKKSKTAPSEPVWIDLAAELLAAGLVKPWDGKGARPV